MATLSDDDVDRRNYRGLTGYFDVDPQDESSVFNPGFYESGNAARDLGTRLATGVLYPNSQSGGFDQNTLALISGDNAPSPIKWGTVPGATKTAGSVEPLSSASGTTNTGADIGKS